MYIPVHLSTKPEDVERVNFIIEKTGMSKIDIFRYGIDKLIEQIKKDKKND